MSASLCTTMCTTEGMTAGADIVITPADQRATRVLGA